MLSRDSLSRALGAAAAAVLAWWLWTTWSSALALLGFLALVWSLASLAGLWLPTLLPRRPLLSGRGRAVLVTGCDSGFGYATALRLEALGVARVFAGVLLPDGPGAAALRRDTAASGRVRVVPLDVTDAASVAAARRVVEEDLEEHGCELWAVVNNAGVFKFGDTEWVDIDDVKQAIEVNAVGQFRVTKEFLPLLRKSKGRVVNVISLAARVVASFIGPYTISKMASLAFSETLRYDLQKFSISVHNIEPWIYHTEMMENFLNGIEERLKDVLNDKINVYNEHYTRNFKFLMNLVLVTAAGKSKIYQVIDSIEDACFAEDPLKRYVPGSHSKFFETISSVFHFFQPFVLNLLFKNQVQK